MKQAEQYKFTQSLMPSLDMCHCLCVFYSFNCETLTVSMQDMAVIYQLQCWQSFWSTSDLMPAPPPPAVAPLWWGSEASEWGKYQRASPVMRFANVSHLKVWTSGTLLQMIKKMIRGISSGFVRELRRCCGSILELTMFFILNVDGWKNSVLIRLMMTI